jgi:LppM domain
MDRSVRRAVPAVLLVAASLLLTGCFRFESTYTINDDGTADVSILTVIDTEQLEKLGGLLGQDTSDLMDLGGEDLLSTLSEGDDPCGDITGSLSSYDVELEEINDGSEVGVKCTVSGVPIDELTTSGQDSSISIEQDDTGTRFTATLQGVDELTGGADTGDITELLGLSLDELFSIVFSVSGPGTLGDNNASSTSGSTATWDITADADFVVDGDATLTAEWTPGGSSSSNAWIIIVAVLVALAGIAVVVFFVLRSRTGTPAPAADAPSTGVDSRPTSPPVASPPPDNVPPPPSTTSDVPPPPPANTPLPPPPPT